MKKRINADDGFTLIELMIVVAIIGILAAVAIPGYINYISKSRMVSLVYPGMRSIENSMALYYATNSKIPDNSQFAAIIEGANTHYFNVGLNGSDLRITIVNDPTDGKFKALDDYTLILTPNTAGVKIISWDLSGSLASKLNLTGL